MSAWLVEASAWRVRAEERWRPREVAPLRLRVWCESEVSWDFYDGITIEGAIQFAVVARETGRHPHEVFVGCDVVVDVPIPIADVEMCGRKVACASWAKPAEEAFETQRKQRRRTDVDEVGGRSKITTSGGALKNTEIPFAALATPYLDFFVRGDAERLRDILRDVQGVGRNWTRGMGTIHAVEIAPDPADRSLVFERRPQRTLPVDSDHEAAILYEYGSYDLRESTTRAPYWLQASKTLAVVPVS